MTLKLVYEHTQEEVRAIDEILDIHRYSKYILNCARAGIVVSCREKGSCAFPYAAHTHMHHPQLEARTHI